MTQFIFRRIFRRRRHGARGPRRVWRCLFANDFDQKKVSAYEANWGAGHIRLGRRREPHARRFARLQLSTWRGPLFPVRIFRWPEAIGALAANATMPGTCSGTFWPFWKLMRGLVRSWPAPRARSCLKNVYGCLTSHGGRDFAAIAAALATADYRLVAAVINASHFVPQSRPRVFFVAVRAGETIPNSLVAEAPQAIWHPAALVEACAGMTPEAKRNWSMVADRRARPATLGVLGPCRKRARGRRMAQRSRDKISPGIDDAAASPKGRRSR